MWNVVDGGSDVSGLRFRSVRSNLGLSGCTLMHAGERRKKGRYMKKRQTRPNWQTNGWRSKQSKCMYDTIPTHSMNLPSLHLFYHVFVIYEQKIPHVMSHIASHTNGSIHSLRLLELIHTYVSGFDMHKCENAITKKPDAHG